MKVSWPKLDRFMTYNMEPSKMREDTKNTPITIRQVGNGFIVDQARSDYDASRVAMSDSSDSKVFNSMIQLNYFIEDHFTHRAKHLISDESKSTINNMSDAEIIDSMNQAADCRRRGVSDIEPEVI